MLNCTVAYSHPHRVGEIRGGQIPDRSIGLERVRGWQHYGRVMYNLNPQVVVCRMFIGDGNYLAKLRPLPASEVSVNVQARLKWCVAPHLWGSRLQNKNYASSTESCVQ